jgi:hypothetical protein
LFDPCSEEYDGKGSRLRFSSPGQPLQSNFVKKRIVKERCPRNSGRVLACGSRRDFLRAGLFGALGLSLPELLALSARAAGNRPSARAQSVLVVLEQGGLSHIDTFDPKPLLPAEHRSPYRTICTSAPGLRFTELLRHTAGVADKLCVVRAMRHKISDHGAGTAYVLQGHAPGGALQHPDIGSVVSQKIGAANRVLPPYIMVPGNHEQASQATSGFLSPALAPFRTGGADLSDPAWSIPNLRARAELAPHLDDRRRLWRQLEADRRALLDSGRAGGMSRFYEQAFDTLDNPRVAAAFDFQREPTKVRSAYGRGHRGACYLLGRRLIEAGVRFVTVDVRWPETPETPGGFDLNWDHHDLIYAPGSCGTVRDKAGGEGRYGIGHWCMMGSTDVAFRALIDDLHQRGLLAHTLVALVTEFGRTPRLNRFQGRDHWPHAYSIVLAGAGIRGGVAVGGTDKEGGQVQGRAFSPADYAATVYHFLGIDPNLDPVLTRDLRPVPLVAGGEVIREL